MKHGIVVSPRLRTEQCFHTLFCLHTGQHGCEAEVGVDVVVHQAAPAVGGDGPQSLPLQEGTLDDGRHMRICTNNAQSPWKLAQDVTNTNSPSNVYHHNVLHDF